MTTEELTTRVDTIDERLDRLTTELESLKDSQKLMREHGKDVLFGIELLGERTNQMIDAINKLSAGQERNDAAIQRTNETVERLSAKTDEAIERLSLKQAETAEIVDRLTKTVDRYLNARLNGNN